MKKMYEFEFKKKETVEVQGQSEENGKPITVIRKEEKEVPVKFILKKPTRALLDDGDFYYSVTLSDGIKGGLLTKALLVKRFNNDGGTLSEDQKGFYTKLYSNLLDCQNKYQRLSLKEESTRTEEEKSEIKMLQDQIIDARREIQDFEIEQSSLFEHTAESRARNKTIIWWLMQLAHSQEEGKQEEPIFGSGSIDDKLNKYAEIEESENVFLLSAIQKLAFCVAAWYSGSASKQEEFEEIQKNI